MLYTYSHPSVLLSYIDEVGKIFILGVWGYTVELKFGYQITIILGLFSHASILLSTFIVRYTSGDSFCTLLYI